MEHQPVNQERQDRQSLHRGRSHYQAYTGSDGWVRHISTYRYKGSVVAQLHREANVSIAEPKLLDENGRTFSRLRVCCGCVASEGLELKGEGQ